MKSSRYGLLAWVLGLAACLALPRGIARQALAAAAGILFEAAPLLLAMSLARRWFGETPFVRRAAGLFGCGCGHAAGPAALSIPAALLAWVTFGPPVALARFCGALVLEARRGTGKRALAADGDPLRELAAIAAPAFALGLGTALFQAAPPHLASGLLPPFAIAAAECGAGVAAGLLAPCTTAAIALAGMARSTAPFAALGILATAGLTPNLASARAGEKCAVRRYDARFASALIAAACAILAARGGSGIVHPRLLPLVWLGCGCAIAACIAGLRTASAQRFVAPLAMLAVLVLGSPTPTPASVSGSWDGAYPGEPVEFTGVAAREGGRLSLVRYAITCCRADASAIVVPTDALRPDIRSGAWLTIRGRAKSNGSEVFLHATHVEKVAAPADVYLYR